MIQALVERIQGALDAVAAKFVTRFIVAIPFVLAAGFGTAAADTKLTEIYGPVTAHAILACVFAVIGLIAALIIAASSRASDIGVGTEAPEPTPEEEKASAAAGVPNMELALAALGTLGPTALTSLLRSLVRNLPLTIGIAVLSYLLIEESIERDRSFGAKPEPAE